MHDPMVWLLLVLFVTLGSTTFGTLTAVSVATSNCTNDVPHLFELGGVFAVVAAVFVAGKLVSATVCMHDSIGRLRYVCGGCTETTGEPSCKRALFLGSLPVNLVVLWVCGVGYVVRNSCGTKIFAVAGLILSVAGCLLWAVAPVYG